MTFAVSRDQGKFEWAGTSFGSIFALRWSILNPTMWRLIFDIIRFNQFALDVLRSSEESENEPAAEVGTSAGSPGSSETIGEYLDRGNYSQAFRDDYLIPMTAAIWSTTPDKCSLHFPAVTLVRFLWNHHLLSTLSKRPDWMTIPGGSRQYVDTVISDIPKDRIHRRTQVTSLRDGDGKLVLLTADGREDSFDHVILATHGDQALEILRETATKEEIDILSGFETSRNVAILHSDLNLMPKRRITWSSWNYITESPFPSTRTKNVAKVCLTYWMNLLQHISESKYGPVLVTLNPLFPPDPRLVQGIWEYSHPLYNSGAIRAQSFLPRIQNVRGISYCGAWTKYGFHEDGFSSGVNVAMNHLRAELPFQFVDSTFSRGRKPVVTLRNHGLRMLLIIIHWIILATSSLLERTIDGLDRIIASRRKVE